MNFLDHHLLSLVIWLPIVGGVLVLLISGSQTPDRRPVVVTGGIHPDFLGQLVAVDRFRSKQ